MSATILTFRPKRDRGQEALDMYLSVRYASGMDSLPLIVRTPFFDALLRQAIGVTENEDVYWY